MYYNLKINYNKSEFALSSLDRDIIEREMDLYFAFFANADMSFIEKIKKIDVHPKIKEFDDAISEAINNRTQLKDEILEIFSLKSRK